MSDINITDLQGLDGRTPQELHVDKNHSRTGMPNAYNVQVLNKIT